MFCRFIFPLCFLLSNVTGLFAQIAPNRTALLGTWEFRQGGMLKSFTGYTAFKSDGTCLQIARGKALGLTSWIYVETSWRRGHFLGHALQYGFTSWKDHQGEDHPAYILPSRIASPAIARIARKDELHCSHRTFKPSSPRSNAR